VVNIADCCPVLIVSPDPPLAGIAHAGWRGAAGGVVVSLIRVMEADGAQVPNLHAWIGPCADGSMYEVGKEVASRFSAYPDAHARHPDGDAKSYLDVARVVRCQLTDAGIPPERLDWSRGGTLSDPRYHSHRRSGFAAGRMAAFLSL
jgi:YfiH family protein